MIFQHADKVLSGEKTQTRRIAKEFDEPIYDWFKPHPFAGHYELGDVIHAVFRDSRKLYEVGQQLAVQPGRGQKAVGRIEITGIRREDVRNISYEDAVAEGFNSPFVFLRTWAGMHDKPADTAWFKHSFADGDESGMISDTQGWMSWLKGQRPAERYQAWVLEFKLVEGA